ncbi:hypothetical protein OK074_7283, partial [Actinobacteria bacterium OK074]
MTAARRRQISGTTPSSYPLELLPTLAPTSSTAPHGT